MRTLGFGSFFIRTCSISCCFTVLGLILITVDFIKEFRYLASFSSRIILSLFVLAEFKRLDPAANFSILFWSDFFIELWRLFSSFSIYFSFFDRSDWARSSSDYSKFGLLSCKFLGLCFIDPSISTEIFPI
jgi:hypothetical protein